MNLSRCRLSMVATAVIALGLLLPATALSTWNHEGTELHEAVEVGWFGEFNFSGGVDCHESTTYASYSGLIALIGFKEKHTAHKNCTPKGTLSALGCTGVSAVQTEELPYTVDNNGSLITITGAKIRYTMTGGFFCPSNVTIEGDISGTPDVAESVGSFAFSGTLTSSLGTNVTVSGTQVVQGEANGTYGL